MQYFDFTDNKERIIIENDGAFAFPTNIPIVPGHTLICPKRHVSTINELTEDELMALFDLQKRLKSAMVRAFAAEGFNYAWNEGDIAGQSVQRLHIHMLPRKKGDTGIIDYDPRKFLYRTEGREISPKDELIAVSSLIKSFL